jgi:hypothetical protein
VRLAQNDTVRWMASVLFFRISHECTTNGPTICRIRQKNGPHTEGTEDTEDHTDFLDSQCTPIAPSVSRRAAKKKSEDTEDTCRFLRPLRLSLRLCVKPFAVWIAQATERNGMISRGSAAGTRGPGGQGAAATKGGFGARRGRGKDVAQNYPLTTLLDATIS